jgi:hypothetical protein
MKQEAAAFTRAVFHLSDNSCLHPINEDSKEHRQQQRSITEQATVEVSRSAACGAIAVAVACGTRSLIVAPQSSYPRPFRAVASPFNVSPLARWTERCAARRCCNIAPPALPIMWNRLHALRSAEEQQ